MFRATSCILNIRTLLYRHNPIDYHIASLARFPPLNGVKTGDSRPRDTCPAKPLPPPKPPKDDSWFWGAMAVLFIAGVGIVAAKGSPEIRDWLTLYAPYVDDLIAILYQENMTYGEFFTQCREDLEKYIAEYSNENQPKQCSLDGKPVPDAPAKPVIEETDEDGEPICQQEPLPVVTQGICEIERCMKELGEFTINNFNTAKEACAYYNTLVDETMNTFTLAGLKKLRLAKRERQGLVKESLNNANNAITRLDEMTRYLDCGVQASRVEIDNTKLLHKNYQELYKAARIKFQWENDKALAKDAQWKSVEAIIDKYVGENESLYPGLKYSAKRPLLQGDMDILLYNTYRYINQLNDELKVAAEGISERVNRAYELLPKTTEKLKAREYQLKATLVKKRADLVKEFKQRYADQKIKNDKLLKEMTKKQMMKHQELLNSRLEQKAKEVMVKFNKMVADKVAAEKRAFAAQLSDMGMKLKVVEDKLNARLKAERETRRSQQLWAAGASLLAATKKGGRAINVNKELNAIEKASEGEDKLVLTVLKSIPASVRENGVVPESVLKEKYKIMESTALKVALVEEDGGPMPVYILSWLQALLLFIKISGIPQDEYEKPPQEPPEYLDTFDLLQRARFWLERGNLAAALRYVSSLQGASRLAAQRWYEAARAHLEVRQAAEAILAHAAAMGLQYI